MLVLAAGQARAILTVAAALLLAAVALRVIAGIGRMLAHHAGDRLARRLAGRRPVVVIERHHHHRQGE